MSGPSVKVTTDDPTYDAARQIFCQRVEFRAPFFIPSEVVARVVQQAMGLFQHSLILNGLTDYAWPADDFELQAHSDGKGGQVVFSTRASVPKPIVLM